MPAPSPLTSRPALREPSPDQLDQMLRVMPSFAWPALVVLIAALAAALVWSIVSSAPVKVGAQGILLSPGGVAAVAAPSDGRIGEILADPGQRVQAGQVVAVLEQPDLASQLKGKRLELAKLEDQKQRIEAFLTKEAEAQARFDQERRASLKNRIEALSVQERTLAELVENAQSFLARGLSTRDRLLDVRSRLQDVRSRRAEAENSLIQIETDEETRLIRGRRELLDLDIRQAALERDIDALEANLARSTSVTAPNDGLIVEQSVNVGDMVTTGAAIMRMLPGDGTRELIAILYVPPADGKRVREGMRVQIIPTTVRVQRHGFIRGEVIGVSTIPVTRDGIMRVVKNATLVDQLTQGGAPVEVRVRLKTDPSTPTGFEWSSGQGPSVPIGNGTMAEGRIVVSRIPLIALVAPQIEALLADIGL